MHVNDDLHRRGIGTTEELDGARRFGEWDDVAHELTKAKVSRKDETSRLPLNIDRSAVRVQKILLRRREAPEVHLISLSGRGRRKRENSCARSRRVNGSVESLLTCGRKEHGIDPAPRGGLPRPIRKRYVRRSDLKSKASSKGAAMRRKVGHHNSRAFDSRDTGQDRTDGTLPDHEHHFIPFDACFLHCFQARIHRLNEKRNVRMHTGGNSNETFTHDVRLRPNELRETPTRGLESCARPIPFVHVALRVELALAVEAPATRDVMVRHNPVSFAPRRNTSAHFGDSPHHLMAENPRSREQAGVDFLHVSAANTASVDRDDDLARTWSGALNLTNLDLATTRVYESVHARADDSLRTGHGRMLVRQEGGTA